ncbi:MAG TPA: hypothetical protein VE442_05075 [Jatrophihabitans sp.]|jgi:hypothetical protein|nr:hypothetical protein [Jatrophihabitans sp.]
MRIISAVAAATVLIAGVAIVEAPAGAAPSPTVRVVVRPVTSAGHHAAGFTVTGEPSGSVDCSVADPSPGAVNRNIEFCSPSAEYAIACWKAAAPHHVLCMRNPRRKNIVLIPRHGAFAKTNPAPARQRAPLAMNLHDGDHCSIRDGGAGPVRHGHPQWSATYFCVHDGVVWAKPGAAHLGVNESAASWTVVTGGETGPLVTRHVAKAWFVGTHHV